MPTHTHTHTRTRTLCAHVKKKKKKTKKKTRRLSWRHRVQCTELRVHWPQNRVTQTNTEHSRAHTHTLTHRQKQAATARNSHGHTAAWLSFASKRITDNRHTHTHTHTARWARAQVCDLLHCRLACTTVSAIDVTYQAAFGKCWAPIELTSHDAKFAERMYTFHI